MRASFLQFAGVLRWERLRIGLLLAGLLLPQPVAATSFVPSGPGEAAGVVFSHAHGAASATPPGQLTPWTASTSLLPATVGVAEQPAELLEAYTTNSMFMLRLSIMGLLPELPTGPGWAVFSIGAETVDALRVWARTDPGATTFLLTAQSLLGVTPEILLEASGPDRSIALDEIPMPATLAELQPVPQPASALLLALGMLGLCRGARVR